MNDQRVKIALIGFGTVGCGVAKIIRQNAEHICHKTGLFLDLAHVVDTDLIRPRPVKLPDGLLHDDLERVLKDQQVTVAVELVGGTTTAAEITKKLLGAGKDVVTANKALLAERGPEIFAAARQLNRCVAFEASCCGGIPVIGTIRKGLAANKITAMYGIVNGTCNYILSEMSSKGKEYDEALKEAQEHGYAEADPTLDVTGVDSAHKLAILAGLAFGDVVDFKIIPVQGIDKVQLADIRFGGEMGYAMKLLAIAERTDKGLSLWVQPSFIAQHTPLAQVSGPFNAVSIFGDAVGHTSYYGQGAGMMPTASAVVADIIEVAQGNASRSFANTPGLGKEGKPARACPAEEIDSRFYIRLSVVDQPGVFAQISKILGDRSISISSCLQHESESADCVPVVIMTHRARKGDVDIALKEIAQLEVSKDEPVCIPVITAPVDN